MDSDILLKFVIACAASGAEEGFRVAKEAAEELGEGYEQLEVSQKAVKVATEEEADAKRKGAQISRDVLEALRSEAAAREKTKQLTEQHVRLMKSYVDQTKQDRAERSLMEQETKKLVSAQTELMETQVQLSQETRQSQEAILQSVDARRKAAEATEQQAEAARKASEAQKAEAAAVLQSVMAFGQLLAATKKLAGAFNDSIEAYKSARGALVGLESIAEGTGNRMSDLQQDIQNLTKSGLLPLADATTAMKNLLSRGYTADQAVKTIERLMDAASFGRQAGLELGEAVRIATEGLRQENSVLVDNAGVTKNVAKMWQEYADAHGLAYTELTQAQKIEAEYQGIMAETAHQVGDAAKLSDEYAGAQARAAKATQRVQVALGEAASQGAEPLVQAFAGLTGGLASVLESSPVLTASLVTMTRSAAVATTGMAGLRVVMLAAGKGAMETAGLLGTAATALKSFATAIGPAGWAAIGLATAVTVALTATSVAAKEAEADLAALKAEAQDGVEDVLHQAKQIEKYETLSAKGTNRTAQETEELKLLSEELVETYGERVGYIDEEGRAIVDNAAAAKDQLEAERQITLEKLDQLDAELKRQKTELEWDKTSKGDHKSDLDAALERAKADQQEAQKQFDEAMQAYQDALQEGVTALGSNFLNLEDPLENVEEVISRLPDHFRDAYRVAEATDGPQQALEELYQALVKLDQTVPEDGILSQASLDKDREFLDAMKQAYEDAKQNSESFEAEMAEIDQRIAEAQQAIVDNMISRASVQAGEVSTALKESIQAAMQGMETEDPQGEVDNFVARYFELSDELSDEIMNTTIPEIQQLRESLLAELATSDVDIGEGASFAESILGDIASPEQLQEMLTRGQQLAEAIAQGTATPTQTQAFDDLQRQLTSVYNSMIAKTVELGQRLSIPVDKPINSLEALAKSASKTSKDVVEEAAKIAASETNFREMSGSVLQAADDLKDFADAARELQAMKAAVEIVRAGADASDDYAGALEYLADATGQSEDATLDNLDAIDREIELKALLLDANIAVAQAEAQFAAVTVQKMIEAGTVTEEQGGRMIDTLNDVIAKLQELDGVSISLDDVSDKTKEVNVKWPWSGGGGGGGGGGGRRGGGGGRRSGGGGGPAKNEALESALKQLEAQKKLGQLTLREEVARLEEIKKAHARTNEEIEQMDQRLFEARKALRKADREHAKAMDQLTIQEEIKLLEEEQALYKRGSEQWRELEREKYGLQKTERRQAYEDAVAMDKLTLQEQINLIEQEKALYKEGTDAYREMDLQRYELKKQLRQQEYELAVYYGELSLADQVRRLEEMAEQYKEGTQARIEIEKQAYDLRIQMAQQYYDLLMSLGQISQAQHIELLEQMLEQETMGSQRYLDLYRQLNTAQRDQRRNAYDTAVFYGQMTLDQQRAFLMQEMQFYAEGSDQRIEIERQLYTVLKQMRDQHLQELQEAYQKQREMLQQWYQDQVKAANKHYDGRIQQIRDQAAAEQKAIRDRIRALQRAKREENRMEEAGRRKRDIEALKQRIQYEHDEYNKRKLMEELGREEADFSKWQRDNEVQDKIDALNLQLQAVQEYMQAEIQLLQEQKQAYLEHLQEEYQMLQEKLEADFNAKKEEQEAWLQEMASYLSSYQEVGQILGKGFAEYFEAEASRAHNVIAGLAKQLQGLNTEIGNKATNLAIKAAQNAAVVSAKRMDRVKITEQLEAQGWGKPTKTGPTTVTVNVNQPVKSPVQTGREVKRAVEIATRQRR